MKERNGEEVDGALVKNAIDSFIALDIDHHSSGGFYQEEFAVPFLQTMTDYFKKDLQQVFQSETFIPDYLNKVEEKLLEEEKHSKQFLPQQTYNDVTRALLINEHCEVLAQMLLQTNDDEKLRGMYTLLNRIKPDGLEALKESLDLHFRTESGGGMVNEPNIVTVGDLAVPDTLIPLDQLGESGVPSQQTFDMTLDSIMAILGLNGAGKSNRMKGKEIEKTIRIRSRANQNEP